MHKSSENGYPSLVADKVARRAMLQLVGVNLILGNVFSTALAAPMQEMKEPDVLRYIIYASWAFFLCLSYLEVGSYIQWVLRF